MRKSTCRPAFGTRPRPADCFWSGGLLDRRTKRSDPSAAQPTALARFIRSCGEARQRGWASQVLYGRALRHVRAPINGAPGARCSRAVQLLLLLAHVCALALTLSVLSHSYARLSFHRLASPGCSRGALWSSGGSRTTCTTTKLRLSMSTRWAHFFELEARA